MGLVVIGIVAIAGGWVLQIERGNVLIQSDSSWGLRRPKGRLLAFQLGISDCLLRWGNASGRAVRLARAVASVVLGGQGISR